MSELKQNNDTELSLQWRITHLGNVMGDLSSLVAKPAAELVGAFYPPRLAKRVNSVITELVNNAVENAPHAEASVAVELHLDAQRLQVTVSNDCTPEQFRVVKAHLERIHSASSALDLLRQTLAERRRTKLSGGIGLIRLVAENKFHLDISYDSTVLTVHCWLELGGLS